MISKKKKGRAVSNVLSKEDTLKVLLSLLSFAIMFYAQTGQLSETEAVVHTLLKITPPETAHKAYYDLGLILQYQERWEEAESAHRQMRYGSAYPQ
jgi:Flp pilus assembly protein TadD